VRLVELRLLAYGSFTGQRLDLSRSGPAVHLIYGPNEAGKSTLLRAILGLFYGIDEKTSDDYLHDKASLRIAARLCDKNGEELAIMRRKGKKDTLLDEDGAPLEEALLSRVLSFVPKPMFRTMFGLDHARLREGGEDLRKGKGDLGESLFQAGVGAPGLHQMLSALEADAGALFRPQGKRLPLNEAIESHKQARRQIREHAMRAEGFRAQEQELEQVRLQSAELQKTRQELLAEHSRLERALRVLPALAKRRELLARRATLGRVVLLAEGAEDARARAQSLLSACETDSARFLQTIATLEKRRADLVVPESLVALSPQLMRRLSMGLGSHLKAAEDLPSRRAELRVLEQEAAAELRALGHPAQLEQLESLRVDAATQARIGKLARELSGLQERADVAQRDFDAAEAALERAGVELAALPPSCSAPQGPSLATSSELALPSEATLEVFRRRFEQLERARVQLEEALARLDERNRGIRLDLDTMEREGTPPTARDLEQARVQRDQLWQHLRAALSAGAPLPEEQRVRAYESALQRGDELADRLRREAQRVSQLARLLSEQGDVARERSRLEGKDRVHGAEAEALASEWRCVWEPIGVQPRSPAEMHALLGKVTGLLDAGRRGRTEAQRSRSQSQQSLERWRAQWSELMARLRLSPEASVEEAQAVLDELRHLFEKVDAMGQLRARIDAMERDARQFEQDVRSLTQRHLPELDELGLAQAAEELARRHDKARHDLERRTQVDEDLLSAREELRSSQERKAEAGRQLDALMHAARVTEIEMLEEAERSSARARDLDAKLAAVEDGLFEQGEGASIEALIVQTAELLPDRVRARLEDLKDELAKVDEDYRDTVHRGGSLESGLDLLKRDDRAPEAAAEAEQHLSRIKDYAQSYARKRLAAELLRREIRRYRDQNQAPIVKRASELFARLSLGRYRSLKVDYDDSDEPVLLCVEQAGRSVKIEVLSDGARDQLYLALRLASLERFAEHSEPMPLVLDDVLIHFDDDRARAALQVLGESSAVTQVLFFTHHARVVELAREAIPKERLVEHVLGQAPGSLELRA
jgi:uncharacterized protein YhaN